MSEIILPRWDYQYQATRANGNTDFMDLASVVMSHYYFYESIYNKLAPYESRQRACEAAHDENGGEDFVYTPPTVELLRELITRPKNISESGFTATLKALVRFCAENKGKYALPTPHPTTVHSIQLQKGNFSLTKIAGNETEVSFAGASTPLIIRGMKNHKDVKHIVVRPKSNYAGVPILDKWEVLTFTEELGYIPLWVDSTANPRFSGGL